MLHIAIIADYQPGLASHDATDAALQHAARALGVNYSTEWVPTDLLDTDKPERVLRFSRAMLIAPGSPYVSMRGALNAIRVARESRRPLLGTCGGFQHIVIEYARNVLGMADAEHGEYLPVAGRRVIRALPCSLAGRTLRVDLAAGSLARRIYGRERIEETYHCEFGLDPAYRAQLEAGGLRVSGVEAGPDDEAGPGGDFAARTDAAVARGARAGGAATATTAATATASATAPAASAAESVGEARVVELPTHPFFVGTLFVPQMRSTRDVPHPVFEAFVKAAMESKVEVEEKPLFEDESASDEE